ncbi:MAG TPA: hypothetical protein VE964_13655, partial [Myxococcales bacterium]|nr:hypothetical protein [Myxococcales bacterium]
MKRTRVVLVLGAALAVSPAAQAYRPFNGTDAAVADEGQMEIELGPAGYVREGSDDFLVAPSAIFNWGFAERWEIVLEGRQFVRLGSDGPEPRVSLQDDALSLKTVLREGTLQEKSGISLALELSMLLPEINGDNGAGAEATLIASQKTEQLTVHLNGAVTWTRAHEAGWFAGAIAEVHDAWTVRPVAEVFADGEGSLPVSVSGLAGAIWRVSDNLSFDAAVRLARAGGVDTTELRAGLTWAFA